MKVKIHNSTWTIKEVSAHSASLRLGDLYCRGMTVYAEKVIYMCGDMLDSTKKEVLIHELAHAYLHETQIEAKETFTEENLCDFMMMYSPEILSVVDKVLKGMGIRV